MAKQSGLGDRLFVAGYDISGDIGSLGNIGGGPAALDSTGIDKGANERIGGLRDGRMEFTSFFNPATNRSHDRFSALPTADAVLTYSRGTALGAPAAGLVGKQIDYSGKRGNDGAFTFEISAQANAYGIEWGLGSGLRADTAATSGASIDYGADVGGVGVPSTAFGLQLYVQLLAFTGTSVTIKVQGSSDDGAGDAFTDITGATTSALSAIGAARIATGPAVSFERYLRLVTTGTFTVATFHATIIRNLATPAF